MAAVNWPSTGMPNPEVFRISPRPVTIHDDSPFTGTGERMLRWMGWHVYIQWNHTIASDYWALFGHFAQSDGGRNTFAIPNFGYRAKRGNKTGGVTLNGAHAAGVTSATITGGSGLFSRGDWFWSPQIAGVPRAHVITSTESGGVIQFRPAFYAAMANGANIWHLDQGLIQDTMELPPGTDFATSMPSPLNAGEGGYMQPFAIELVSARRISP